jgi:hypothetical protein
MRIKQYAFVAASVVFLALALASPALAAQGNSKPCLCHPAITPMKGTARTVYIAMVFYHDNDGDNPAKVEVYIDNVAYPMRLVGGRAANGTYRARLTLPPGEHSYYFATEDIRGASERFPRYGARPGPFVGTTKQVYNIPPTLSEGGVYPDQGGEHSIYTYTIRYKDRDMCKPPRAVRVIVDGICHDMSLHGGVPTNGLYLYRTMLPLGPHAYYFGALDDMGDCTMLPQAGYLRGPDVIEGPNSPPVLCDNYVDPQIGGPNGRYGFRVVYKDVDLDPASIALIYIDGEPHAMKLMSGKAYSGVYRFVSNEYLSNFHDYYFYFEDGKGGTCRLPPAGSFHGPVVVR